MEAAHVYGEEWGADVFATVHPAGGRLEVAAFSWFELSASDTMYGSDR